MSLPFEIRIGLRYTRAGRRAHRRNAFISFISAISIGGIALGVMALIVVLSVMNGFQRDVRDRMLSVIPHVQIEAMDGALRDWNDVAARARSDPEVTASAPLVQAQAMLIREDAVRGVLISGIDPAQEPHVSDIVQHLQGAPIDALAPGQFGIVLGRELARALGVDVGDKVTVVVPQGNLTPAGMVPRLKQFRVVATFSSGHYEFDSALALINLSDAERLFRLDAPTAVRLRLRDMQQAPQVAQRLARLIGPEVLVRDWSSVNRTWFAATQIEKRMMFLILALIVAVAAFNLVSTLVMTVTEKHADIAILRTLGASPGSVMAIFMIQGALVGLLGVGLGVSGGLLLATHLETIVPVIEHAFGIHFLDPSIYFISELPSDPRASDIVPICAVSLVLSFVATLYPSWRASRIRPAEALRYD
ncbi:MAG TPA: lipoprotein-releasing ABC transporter permease subunit [Burkholderiaceae bacterium]|nr:lipoprotein-releasing ABC transporter permease subunit [Burkholderiaceae bacterium]